MRVICLDSHIYVWGVKGQASEGQEDMIPRAKNFLHLIEENQPLVIVPSVVLFELLMPIAPQDHMQFVGRFRSNFMVVPFDVPAARLAAQVWHTRTDDGVIEDIRKNPEASRKAIIADCQIIGTALAHGASCIYSHDKKQMTRLSKGFIDVLEMEYEPDLFSQPQQASTLNNENENGDEED